MRNKWTCGGENRGRTTIHERNTELRSVTVINTMSVCYIVTSPIDYINSGYIYGTKNTYNYVE